MDAKTAVYDLVIYAKATPQGRDFECWGDNFDVNEPAGNTISCPGEYRIDVSVDGVLQRTEVLPPWVGLNLDAKSQIRAGDTLGVRFWESDEAEGGTDDTLADETFNTTLEVFKRGYIESENMHISFEAV